jgi:hypothetical protein
MLLLQLLLLVRAPSIEQPAVRSTQRIKAKTTTTTLDAVAPRVVRCSTTAHDARPMRCVAVERIFIINSSKSECYIVNDAGITMNAVPVVR